MLEEYLELKDIDRHHNDLELSLKKSSNKDIDYPEQCKQGIFVEPMKWMGSRNTAFVNGDSISEKLYCEKCNSKIGGFAWSKSIVCSCGIEMGPPGFYIQISRVDRCTMIKEVEVSI